jgi:hypothetical protein
MGEERCSQGLSWKYPREIDRLEDLSIDESIMLQDRKYGHSVTLSRSRSVPLSRR